MRELFRSIEKLEGQPQAIDIYLENNYSMCIGYFYGKVIYRLYF